MDTLSSPKYIKLIDLLRDARKQKGWSQTKLANQLGISQSTVAKAEILERRIDIVELFIWLEALGCEPCHLFLDSGFVAQEQVTSLVIRPALNDHENKIIASFIEKIPLCAYLVDMNSKKIINGNNHAAQFYGYSVREFKDMPLKKISLQPDQELQLSEKTSLSCNTPLMFRHRTVNKSIRLMALNAISVVRESDQPLICFIARDISNEIKQELESHS